ncbi:hypothetical protein H2200_012804 [Cladophialophora chaetospira]|uniref:Carboxylic ester hydrolase n=1 Tax=Cladophialophora chaetospira TaxID=386627 RepID=A0AA38WWV0_9EURO|nr:hypothetical protein H2200_012804 [Cladophialophora chaetospira]
MNSLTGQAPLSGPIVPPAFLPNLTERCLSSTLPKPTLFGAEIFNVTSSLVTNYTAAFTPPNFFNSDPPLCGVAEGLSFCNITVTYTHPGQNDSINVFLSLPVSISDDVFFNSPEEQPDDPQLQPGDAETTPEWNGILLSIGGGGFSTCLPEPVSHAALSQGYALSRTDGGHPPLRFDYAIGDVVNPPTESWGLLSPGNVNLYNFQDFASVALHDMAVISKDIIDSFYHMPPRHSYFQGCSTGGRQGLMLAQRYPTDYDGILSGAPALFFPKLMVNHWNGQMIMHAIKYYPKACELDAITRAAIAECDELDGVKDGIISNESACNFDPFPAFNHNLRGEKPCTMLYADVDGPVHETVNISMSAAHIAYHLWGGAKGSIDRPNWHHPTHGTPLGTLAATKCYRGNNTCQPNPNALAMDWFRIFLYKNPSLTAEDLASRISLEELERLFHQADQEYHSLISTSDPDLSAFANAGGKLIAWHGTSDSAIPPGQTTQYYESVLEYAKTPYSGIEDVSDFFRLYMVPGVDHCAGGDGALPINALLKLRKWVEEGIAPEELDGESFGRSDGEKIYRKLCRYPSVARYRGGDHDSRKAESFTCADSF